MSTLRFSDTAQNSVLLQEQREAKKLELKSERAQDRRERLLNARWRTMGLDIDFLDQQVQEHQRQKEEEKEREYEYDRQQRNMTQAVTQWEREKEAEKEKRMKQLKEYQQIQKMQSTCRDTADLDDKKFLKKDLPGRISDNDPRCGPSSIQQFDGEDLHAAERVAMQAEQLRTWNAEQHRIRLQQLRDEEIEDREYAEWLRKVADEQEQYDKALQERSRQRWRETNELNKKLAEERRELEKLSREQEYEEGKTYRELKGLNDENPEDGYAYATLGYGRLRTDHFRGQREQDRLHHIELIKQQLQEKEEQKRREEEEERRFAEQQNEYLRELARYEAAQREQKQKEKQHLKEQLDKQVEDEKERKRIEEEERRRFGFDQGFFGRFGQSDR
eukprot:gb/GECG01001499.1/.p1 GENE.gb/GECG01001499.1/~~gb/GECG01001499.1/.p1  ORF type:complete len:389 (+),score=104.98 gb/GECG01001499.1/:1-1167(+)